MKKSALILIDLQNDFMPGGTVGVANAHEVAPLANQIIHQFDFVVAAQNWHHPRHISFASQHPAKNTGEFIEHKGKSQQLWADHCIQKTHGAALIDELDKSGIDHVIRKGTHPEIGCYSAFYDNHERYGTGLHTLLQYHNIHNVYLLGLRTDYSVHNTAVDGIKLGYQLHVLHEACRGINEHHSYHALKNLAAANAKILSLAEI